MSSRWTLIILGFVLLLAGASTGQGVPYDNRPKILLHVTSAVEKASCSVGSPKRGIS
jgi:hypothetical protein